MRFVLQLILSFIVLYFLWDVVKAVPDAPGSVIFCFMAGMGIAYAVGLVLRLFLGKNE